MKRNFDQNSSIRH